MIRTNLFLLFKEAVRLPRLRSRGHRGRVAEKIASNLFVSKNYQVLESKIEGNHGFDACFVKYDRDKITEICIIETKFTPSGSFSFGRTSIGVQSSKEWVWGTLIKMSNSSNVNVKETAKLIVENMNQNIVKVGVVTVSRRQCDYDELYTLEAPDRSLPHWRGVMKILGVDVTNEVQKYEPNLAERAINLFKSVRNILLNIDKVVVDIRSESELYADVIELQYYFGLSVVECSRFKPHSDDLGDSIVIRGSERKCHLGEKDEVDRRYVRVGSIKQRQILDELKENIEQEYTIKPLNMSLETFKSEFDKILFKHGISNIDRYFNDNRELAKNDDIELKDIRERLLLKSRRYVYIFDLQTKLGFSLEECASFRPHTMECGLDTSEMKIFIKEGRSLKPNHQSFVQFKAGYITLLQQCGIYDIGRYNTVPKVSLPNVFSPTRFLLNKANPLPFGSIEEFGKSRFTCLFGLQLLFDLPFEQAVLVRPYDNDLGSHFKTPISDKLIKIKIRAQRDILSMASSLVAEGFELKPTSMKEVDFKKKYIAFLKENNIDDIDKYLSSNLPMVRDYINNVSYILTDDKIEDCIGKLLSMKNTIRYGCLLGLQFYFKLNVQQACNVKSSDFDDTYLNINDTKLKITSKKQRDVINFFKETVATGYRLRPTSISEKAFTVNYYTFTQKQDMFFLEEYLRIGESITQIQQEPVLLPAVIESEKTEQEIMEPISDIIIRPSFSNIIFGRVLSVRDMIVTSSRLAFDTYFKKPETKETPKQLEEPKLIEQTNNSIPEHIEKRSDELTYITSVLETYNSLFIINGVDIRSSMSNRLLCLLGLQVCFNLDFESCRMMTSKNDKGDFLMVSPDHCILVEFPPKRKTLNMLGIKPLQPNSISRDGFEKEYHSAIAGGKATVDSLRRKVISLVERYRTADTPPSDMDTFMKKTIDTMCLEAPRFGFILGVQYYLKLSITEATTISIKKDVVSYKDSEHVIKTLPSTHPIVKSLISSMNTRLQPNSIAKDTFIAQYFNHVQGLGIYKYSAYVPSYVPRFKLLPNSTIITKDISKEPRESVKVIPNIISVTSVIPALQAEVTNIALIIGKKNKDFELLFKMSIYFDASNLESVSSFCIDKDDYGDHITIGGTKHVVDTSAKRVVLEEVRERSWKGFAIRKRLSAITFVSMYNEALKENNISNNYAVRNKQALYEICRASTTNRCDINLLPKTTYNLIVLQILFGMSVDECVSFVPSADYSELLKRKIPKIGLDPEKFLAELRAVVWKDFPMRLRRSARSMKIIYLADLQIKGIVDVDVFIRDYVSKYQ